jgi:acetyl/propionyl-CoA carboxylase alpha subunit
MKIQFEHNSQPFALDLTPTGKNYRVTLDDKTVIVEVLRAENGRLDLLVDGKPICAYVSSDGAKRWVTLNGQTFMLTKSAGTGKRSGHGGHVSGALVAPMPGLVRAVQVAAGETVSKGQTLVIIEAMKMEIKIVAPKEGVVKTLNAQLGQTVERDQVLLEME